MTRLPAHLEVSGLLRQAEAAGGFGMVLRKGERDAGTILLVLLENGKNARLFERMPTLDGDRAWTISKAQDAENKKDFEDYLARRTTQDRDIWLIELDVASVERFVRSLTGQG